MVPWPYPCRPRVLGDLGPDPFPETAPWTHAELCSCQSQRQSSAEHLEAPPPTAAHGFVFRHRLGSLFRHSAPALLRWRLLSLRLLEARAGGFFALGAVRASPLPRGIPQLLLGFLGSPCPLNIDWASYDCWDCRAEEEQLRLPRGG